jgi:Predicted glycosyltransferases
MDIAVVILNWNGKHFMQKYLPILVSNTADVPGAFIVVADNGSDDGSVEWLETGCPEVQLVKFDRNYGFAEGYNKALEVIDADYYVLLNSDVEVPAGWLQPLVSFMEEHPDVGICQPKILSEADHSRFEYAGAAGGYIDSLGYPFCRGRILSNLEVDKGQYDEPVECFWATGACLMTRAALYHHLGGLDASFWAHMEEIDMCWRAKLLGYEVWCIPQSKVYHVGGGMLPNDSPKKLFLNYRNNLFMLYKNLPSSIRENVLRRRIFLDDLSAIVYLLTGHKANWKAVKDAHREFAERKEDMEVSPFSESRNDKGLYEGSIVFKFFLSGKKLTFDKLKF